MEKKTIEVLEKLKQKDSKTTEALYKMFEHGKTKEYVIYNTACFILSCFDDIDFKVESNIRSLGIAFSVKPSIIDFYNKQIESGKTPQQARDITEKAMKGFWLNN